MGLNPLSAQAVLLIEHVEVTRAAERVVRRIVLVTFQMPNRVFAIHARQGAPRPAVPAMTTMAATLTQCAVARTVAHAEQPAVAATWSRRAAASAAGGEVAACRAVMLRASDDRLRPRLGNRHLPFIIRLPGLGRMTKPKTEDFAGVRIAGAASHAGMAVSFTTAVGAGARSPEVCPGRSAAVVRLKEVRRRHCAHRQEDGRNQSDPHSPTHHGTSDTLDIDRHC